MLEFLIEIFLSNLSFSWRGCVWASQGTHQERGFLCRKRDRGFLSASRLPACLWRFPFTFNTGLTVGWVGFELPAMSRVTECTLVGVTVPLLACNPSYHMEIDIEGILKIVTFFFFFCSKNSFPYLASWQHLHSLESTSRMVFRNSGFPQAPSNQQLHSNWPPSPPPQLLALHNSCLEEPLWLHLSIDQWMTWAPGLGVPPLLKMS